MSVARVTEITAQSPRSFQDAVALGIRRANQTLRNVTGAWIKEQQVSVENGRVNGYRVNMLVTFILEDAPSGRGASRANAAAMGSPAPATKKAAAKKSPARKAAKRKTARRR
jgi:flavin-binding protein dodecin